MGQWRRKGRSNTQLFPGGSHWRSGPWGVGVRPRQRAGITREMEVIAMERFASGYSPAKIARALRVSPVVVQVLLRDPANVRILRALRRLRVRNTLENSGFCRFLRGLQYLDSVIESKKGRK